MVSGCVTGSGIDERALRSFGGTRERKRQTRRREKKRGSRAPFSSFKSLALKKA